MPTSVTLLLAILGFAALLAFFWVVGMAPEVQRERAREMFRLQPARLEQMFLEAARKSGVPRGLFWLSCDFVGEFLLARDRHNRRLVAFVPVTVRFEADPDGDMVGLPAVDLPRHATAVFSFERGHWATAGKVVFNHTPEEVMERFAGQYESVGV